MSNLKSYFYCPIYCKYCNKKTFSGIAIIFHLLIKHKQFSWKATWLALRAGIEMRILLLPFILVYAIILGICWPFWWVYENFGFNTNWLI